MKIYNINVKGEKELTGYKGWMDLISNGWILTEIRGNMAIMVRNGYINQFVNEV